MRWIGICSSVAVSRGSNRDKGITRLELISIKALWGMTGKIEEQLERIASAGYKGVEAGMNVSGESKRFLKLLEANNLKYIAQVVTLRESVDWRVHLASFREQAQQAAEMGALLINSHSARDCMSYDDQCRFFEQALSIEKQLGITVGHETHRGRAFFTPWTTAKLLAEFPELRITADISHWFCVCESWLQDQGVHLTLSAERTIHIHGRIGYPQGPQVPHPAAPEYKTELEIHETFWDKVYAERLAQGASHFTFTAEFGPPGYMHTLPFTKQPVADLWEICLWMTKRFEQRLSSKYN
ncbi:MAG: sugar phosphate isomerase/epimerase [Bacilli bacterium]|nr:sugar phosphate isomerase/epimerase [Bacilli bacterium]